MGAPQQVSAADIESVIRSLTCVQSVRVVTGKGDAIEEIHVLTDSSRAPKQLVRDVESALMAEFGLELDHKKVSIAQTQNGKRSRFVESRLKLSDVSISLNGTQAGAAVRLACNGTYMGQASGHSAGHGQLRLIATATLQAIQSRGGPDTALVLDDLNPSVNLSGQTVVVVSVNMIGPRGEELLIGSAMVKQDLWKAVVNATLDAINRRLGIIREQ
jgi:hypothetical protein